MKEHFYLTFSLKNYYYCIDINYVEEIVLLPELAIVPERTNDVVGVISFRGNTCPVLDLNSNFDCPITEFKLTDSLVILKWQELRVGLLANIVYEVKSISSDTITPVLPRDRALIGFNRKDIPIALVKGLENTIILSKPETLVRYAATQQLALTINLHETHPEDNQIIDFQPSHFESLSTEKLFFNSNVNSEARVIFRERADVLKQSQEEQNSERQEILAVFRLQSNYFGVALKLVREFTDISKVTPIPCCPSHIVGNMNLRGEVLTLIDICKFVNLLKTPTSITSKVMIVEVEDIVVGILVDEVYDVMFFLNPRNIVSASSLKQNEYVQEVVVNGEKIIGLLDLSRMLLSSELTVNEMV